MNWSNRILGALRCALLAGGYWSGFVGLAHGAPATAVRLAAEQALQQAQGPDQPTCYRIVDAVADQALAAWSDASVPWLKARLACLSAQQSGNGATVEQLDDTYGRAQQLLATAPQETAELAELGMHFLVAHTVTLVRAGFAELAEQLEEKAVRAWLQRLKNQPNDAIALAALNDWGRRWYGARERVGRLGYWLQVVPAELGPGHRLEFRLLVAQAFASRQLGRPALALDAAQRMQALAATYFPNDERMAANVASELGLALASNGRLSEGLEQLLILRGLLERRQPVPHDNLMRLHYGLASIALEMGDDDATVAYADESVRHSQLLQDPRFRFESRAALLSREQARLRRGDADAPAALRAIIELTTETGPGTGEAAYALARHALRTGNEAEYAWARQFIDRYAAIHLEPSHGTRPMLTLLDAEAAPSGSALRLQTLGLAAAQTLGGRSGAAEAKALFALAHEVSADRPDQALWLYKRGANVLQKLRAGLDAGDLALQRAWLREFETEMRSFIALLIDRGRLAEAQQAMRVLRDEELHEYTRRSQGGARRGSSVALALSPHEHRLDEALKPAVLALRQELLAADARLDRQSDWLQRTQRSDAAIESAWSVAAAHLQRLVHESSPAQADDTVAAQPTPLPHKARRLSYFVRADSLDIVVQGPGGLRRVRQPIHSTELNRLVHALRVALVQPQADARKPAQALHQVLLAPVAALLKGASTLHIVADAALRFVPFAALHDGQAFVTERHVVLYEAGRPVTTRDPASPLRPAALAMGRTQADAEHAALPGVADELNALREARAWSVTTLLDRQFTADVLQRELQQRRPALVHLASHFVLDAAHEQGAYLLMGDGERLPLPRLRSMAWQGVHLAVLSACDTGRPEIGSSGQQFSGLAAALHDGGAAHVLATLWPVNDRSTAAWMADFYRQGSQGGALPQAHWVAQAQRDWLRRHAGTPLAHPHHWAGFVWMSAG